MKAWCDMVCGCAVCDGTVRGRRARGAERARGGIGDDALIAKPCAVAEVPPAAAAAEAAAAAAVGRTDAER